MLGYLATLLSLVRICCIRCFCGALDMEDTDGRAVRAVAPMTKEAVLDALKEKLLLDGGGGVVANENSEAYGKWLLLSARNIESIMSKGVKSVAGVVGTDDYGIVRDAMRSLAPSTLVPRR